MTEVKMFYGHKVSWEDSYEYINEKINNYAKEHDLIIKEIYYDRWQNTHSIIANVLFSDIPNELFLL